MPMGRSMRASPAAPASTSTSVFAAASAIILCTSVCLLALLPQASSFSPLKTSSPHHGMSWSTQARPRGMHLRLSMLQTEPLTKDDYVCVGLACCFKMNDANKLEEYWVYEPLSPGTLETISLGGITSYKRAMGMTLGDLLEGEDVDNPTGLKTDKLQALVDGESPVAFGEDMVERTLASARSMRRRKGLQLVPVGEVVADYNFNTNRKRVVNEVYEPSFDDNVKQDKTIDVYGRFGEEDVNKQIAQLENL